MASNLNVTSRTGIKVGELLHEPSRLFVFVGFSDGRRLALVVWFDVIIIIVIVGVSRRHRIGHDADESPLSRGKALRDALGRHVGSLTLRHSCADVIARSQNPAKERRRDKLPGLVEQADELLALVGPWDVRERTAKMLAHGQQRALEIGMALASRPRLLLLDEPTAGMGDQETYNITQLIRKLHKDGKLTIVLIEHDMRVVFHLADRIMVLDQGKFLAEGTPQEIAANKAVQTAYLGQAA